MHATPPLVIGSVMEAKILEGAYSPTHLLDAKYDHYVSFSSPVESNPKLAAASHAPLQTLRFLARARAEASRHYPRGLDTTRNSGGYRNPLAWQPPVGKVSANVHSGRRRAAYLECLRDAGDDSCRFANRGS